MRGESGCSTVTSVFKASLKCSELALVRGVNLSSVKAGTITGPLNTIMHSKIALGSALRQLFSPLTFVASGNVHFRSLMFEVCGSGSLELFI
ncbi:hypothetical protein RRG08_002346 [Elysia crispata]|uniref:Uncharacterized protein n=1 Tax=Elysia crispata TaxID=231223 RepID=A0AAE0ZAZ2_9GAST|nr:hypothetical protein RRG08_002346 [Elysia crispata]